MSKIDNLTAELCDELMIAASCGKLEHIKSVILMLIEYSSVELGRHDRLEAASALHRIAKDIEISLSLRLDKVD
ncbi:hypothetical protein [Roseovarius aestuarii]|uniref:Uncharacterized protein n=1 Tax=Roseovarius aestuarii TaxID=475083 RepID=A0A1X7BX03_9RHOB|nr:hypothetical protein [Roseovarius aestuarii]SMC13729.1 hypothetical protein ROA7745_03588 [Roseovarius aestuarii]